MGKHFVFAAAALLFTVWGCGHQSAAEQQVRSAAAVDLDCEESVIEIIDNQPMLKRVSGCGKTLSYMNKCNPAAGGGQSCRWRAVPEAPQY